MILRDSNVVERLLRNRGRTQRAIADYLTRRLRRDYLAFIEGQWKSPPTWERSNYRLSLTSWRPRLVNLPLVLLALCQQTLRPKEIIVWLTPDDRKAIAGNIIERFSDFEVRFATCDDLKPHKKWLPVVEEGQTDPFVICDDDIIYPRDWFKRLVAEDRIDSYVGCKCHRIIVGAAGAIAPYSMWQKQISSNGVPSHGIFVTGVGGAIIHPHRIPRKFVDRAEISRNCPTADDVWLKAAHLAAGIPCYKTQYSFPCLEIPGSETSGLAMSNVDREGNDEQIQNVRRYFSAVSGLT